MSEPRKRTMRCKTCRYYEPKWHIYIRPTTDQTMICTNPRLGELVEPEYLADGNYLSYPYNEGGVFEPGPEFGCINHEEASCTD